jgi:glycerophosphoryl diester phosphodiesterase
VTARHPYLDWPGPIPFAHRGGAGDWPENTMPAFEGAVALGYHYVETDVHATSDGVLLAFHDDVLDRVTDRAGTIAELPWSVVREAKVAGREPIPRFEDLLGAWPDLRVNVDPKHDAAVAPLADALRRAGALDRVCVGSFSDARLTRLRRELGPGLCTALTRKATARLRAASIAGGRLAGRIAGLCAQVPVAYRGVPLVDARFVTTAHAREVQVHVWTIDEEEEMHRLLDLGVDGIMTDRPAVLRAVLEARGQWVAP